MLSEIYTAIAQEVRLRGGHQVLAPVVDLARDLRWGRTEECLGEDPYHVSRMCMAEFEGAVQLNIKLISRCAVLSNCIFTKNQK